MALEAANRTFLATEDQMRESYLKQMQSLQKIREVAGGHLDFPQICVVGDQSSGKSALLSCLTGLNFPESSGICTRAPIVVRCRRTDLPNDVYEIQNDPAKSSYTKCNDLDHLRCQISEIQEAAITKLRTTYCAEARPEAASSSSDVSFEAEIIPASEDTADLEQHNRVRNDTDREDLSQCKGLKKSKMISTEEICVQVSGPTQMDIIIVDLPGIIHNGDGADETRELIEKYCKPKQTLMLLVSEAKQDYESIEAIALAQKYDPSGERTLRVLTKFDVFDSPESRQRAENEIVPNSRQGNALASHAVVCRHNGSPYDAAKEAEMLAQSGLPVEKSGVGSLKSRLPALFSQLIAANLPNLRTQIHNQLEISQNVLEQVGTEAVEGMSMVKSLQSILPTRTELEITLTPHIEQLNRAVAQTKEKITKDWTDSFFQNNAFMVSMFQGNDALLKCLDEITKWWAPLLLEYHEAVKHDVRRVSDAGRDRTKSMLSAPFLQAFSVEWSKHCNEILFQEFNRKCEESLLMEQDFGTINHYLDSKYQEQMVLPDSIVQALVADLEDKVEGFNERHAQYWKLSQEYMALKKQHDETQNKYGRQPYSKSAPEEPPPVKELLRDYLESLRAAYITRYETTALFGQQKERLYRAVLAVWAVEHKTFVDIVLKQTRDVIITGCEDWIRHGIYFNNIIRQNAMEDDEIRKKRSNAKKRIELMNRCLKELNDCERV